MVSSEQLGLLLLVVCLQARGLRAAQLYPYGPQIDRVLPSGDDLSQDVPLQVPVKFYGQVYPNIFVNTNGLLSFLTEIPKFYNEPFPLEYPVVAPLYSNVDTRGGGAVYYRESREPDVLSNVARKVSLLYPDLPAPFRPVSAFIATWQGVGYHDSKGDKTNTFQAVVSTDGSESFAELLYPEGGIEWIRAEPLRPSLPDARAQAGISSPGGKVIVLKGSGTDRVHNLPSWTNTLTPGEFMFRIGNIEDTGQPEAPQRTIEQGEDEQEEPTSCADEGSLICHKNAECQDEPSGGFCCRCQRGYVGDGRNCLDSESHRMLGKVNITINGVQVKDLNMQAYIVTADGRTYTAISGVPPSIGNDMMLLTSLGSFVGFLFAKPIGDAPNGYQLTGGVVNHTVDVTFGTRHRATIHQRYTGLDLFEQVKMEAEVSGTLPAVPPGTRLNVLDFQEHFTRVAPGLFRSQSKHVIEADTRNERHEISVDQTVQFTEFCPSAYRGLSSLRLKSSRHYLNYEEKDMILRLASTNKISQNSEGQDPCVEGHVTCVANSTCLVEEDSFRCVCNPGFQAHNDQTSEFECRDINECEDGSANCHPRALCVNEVGTYSCQCLPGYTGNGRFCEALEAPTIPNGVCQGFGVQRRCQCNPGYQQIPDNSEHGFRCEDIDECTESNPCDRNSQCINTPGGFSCECHPGFTGDGFICIEDNGDGGCDSLDCPVGTVCVEKVEGAYCSCRPGYHGDPPYCVPIPPPPPPISEPLPSPEDNGDGGCDSLDCPVGTVCVEKVEGAYCSCRPGYHGDPPYCVPIPPPPPPISEPYPEPLPSPDVPEEEICRDHRECRENFQCIYNPSRGASFCTCRQDYTLDRSGSCLPPAGVASFVRTCIHGSCWCPPGYTDNGELCVLSTTPSAPPPAPRPKGCGEDPRICSRNARCIYIPNSPGSSSGSYECKCNAGYEGDGFTCSEFEVSCNTNSQICDLKAECKYDRSSDRHICICNEGFEGDGTNCYPSEDNCENCHQDAECYSTTCVCREGFIGDGVKTCERSIPGCDSLGNCHPDADCLYDSQELGYRCKCRQGFEGDGYACDEIITCHENPGLCDPHATCHNTYLTYECRCNEGYFGNGTICKEINRQEEEFLLLNKGGSTIRLPFNPTGSNIGRPIQINGGQRAIGIAVDCLEGRVYWSDITNQKIKSSKFDGSDIQDFITTGVMSTEGLAIDWLGRVLYWTDSSLDVIASASLDDRQVKHIITTGLVNPRGIAVHPYQRKLFWSDWNRKDPIIESSDLDGRNREVLIQKPSVSLPNSLAIDWSTNEICWADAGLKKIECYDYLRRIPRTVVQNCFYPFGLAITPDAYYWTDWSTGKVESSKKGSGVKTRAIPLPIGGDDKLYGLVAVTSQCPQ